MKKILLGFVILCLAPFLFGQEMVEKIEIVGNERVTRETVLYYLSSREGDFYSEELLRRDFRTLWSTGFFSNIRIEKIEGANGKIVKIIVEENPVVKNIIYKTGKKLKENDIVDKLKETDEYILPYSYYNEYKIKMIQTTIESLLIEKGLTSGKVKVKINKKGKNELEVLFDINEGPKVKVGEVEFEGKTKLLKSVVRGAMKENKKHGLIAWIIGKDVFKQNKLSEDLASIKEKYREHGYMEATIGEPRFEEITKRSIFFKKQKMKKIIIPINAGYRYTVGEVKIEGNKILSSKGLRKLIQFKEGDVYSTKIREKSIEDIGELYRDLGYLRSGVFPVEKLDPKRKRVNVTFNIIEGDLVYLNRLEFRGNTFTKDKVIRREMLMREGDRFSLALFKDSILRMSQLGLVEPVGEPEIKPNPEDPNKMDVIMNIKELQRNNIQFSAGYSGYEGTFIALSYSTVNFLGAGEKLELMLQHGKRIKNYMFGFSEPYFLDQPVSLGFNIYNRNVIYPYLFDQKAKGINFTTGGRIKGYLRGNLTYAYEYIDITADEGSYYAAWGGGYAVSSITPSLYRSTVNSPLTPTRGSLYSVSSKFAGGFLGGQLNFIKPRFEWTFYHPLVLNHVIGFHIEYQFIKVFGDSNIPVWEKFFLGGERSIRGYEIYSIRGDDNTGGEKSLVFNAEYIIPMGGPLYAIFFYDLGNAFGRDQKIGFNNLYSSTGLEMRIFVPALRVPFRLIFSYNNRKPRADDSNFAFRFAIGTTF
jgi:outer membrane protein insertion porin family